MNIVCDECKKEFDLNIQNVVREAVSIEGEEVARTYILCPFCRIKYDVSYEDKNVRKLIGELKRIEKVIPLSSFIRQKVIENKRNEIKKCMEVAKRKYEEYESI